MVGFEQKPHKVFVTQVGRFILAGGIATAIDLLVLNILVATVQLDSGAFGFDRYLVFKTASFICAATTSYFINKYFTFRASNRSTLTEVSRFAIVTMLGFCANVIVPTLLFSLFSQQYLFSDFWRANISSISGTAVSLIVNFFGYKLFVFRK